MSSFKGARASAWELLPSVGVMVGLLTVLIYSKKPVDYLLYGRPVRILLAYFLLIIKKMVFFVLCYELDIFLDRMVYITIYFIALFFCGDT